LTVVGQFHFDPHSYLELMHSELPDYERLQEELVRATRGTSPATILELGIGTGETARDVGQCQLAPFFCWMEAASIRFVWLGESRMYQLLKNRTCFIDTTSPRF
jgi:hypothetical protein